MYGCVPASTSGFTRTEIRARLPSRRATAVDSLEFGRRLDVEAQDVGRERALDLRLGLADAGKHRLARVAAGREDALEFAAGDDVESGPAPGQQVEHRQVRVGLHRVADERAAAARARRRSGRRRARSRGANTRRAGFRSGPRALASGSVLAVQLSVAVAEPVAVGQRGRHLFSFVAGTSGKGRSAGRASCAGGGAALDCGAGGGGGSTSGPFCPHAASAHAAVAARIVAPINRMRTTLT